MVEVQVGKRGVTFRTDDASQLYRPPTARKMRILNEWNSINSCRINTVYFYPAASLELQDGKKGEKKREGERESRTRKTKDSVRY